MDTISLEGLNKADVLAVLYNAAKPQGMGFMQYDPTPMTREQAEEILAQTTTFDYLKGRVMKVSLSGNEINPWLFDRDNGPGAAERAIESLRQNGNVNGRDVQASHHVNTLDAAEDAKSHLAEETSIEEDDGEVQVRIGMADVADRLEPMVDESIDRLKK